MKKIIMLSLIAALMFAVWIPVAAQVPAPGGPFTSWFRVQNMGAGTSQCSYVIYTPAGAAQITSAPINLAVEDSLYVYMPTLAIPSGEYSSVVSCTQPAAAAVNIGDSNSDASHNGIAAPATSWFIPGLYDNYFCNYSNFVVQNAAGSPVNITLDIYAPNNPVPVFSDTKTNVPAYGTVKWDQANNASLANNVSYSGKLTATGVVAPVGFQYGVTNAQPCSIGDRLYSFNAFPSGTTGKIYAPVLENNYFGWNTAMTVQNTSASTNNYKVTYSNGVVKNGQLAGYSSAVHFTPNEGLPSGNTNGIFAAVVETTNGQPLVITVTQSNTGAYLNYNKNRASSYTGPAIGATKVFAPMVLKRFLDASGGRYNSSITCQNLGGSSTVMTLKFFGYATTTSSPSIAAGGSHVFYVPSSAQVPDNWIGSATISASASQPIACVVNQNQNEAPERDIAMDKFMSYNAAIP